MIRYDARIFADSFRLSANRAPGGFLLPVKPPEKYGGFCNESTPTSTRWEKSDSTRDTEFSTHNFYVYELGQHLQGAMLPRVQDKFPLDEVSFR